MAEHEFGWIQNPNDFKKLKYTVQILVHNSFYNRKLLNGYINNIYDQEKRKNLIDELNKDDIKIKYSDMVGRVKYRLNETVKTRPHQVADGLVQLAAGNPNLEKVWTDDWTSSGYVNWALTFHFIEVNAETDLVSVTKFGEKFALSEDSEDGKLSDESVDILRKAVLAYPPAVRVMYLLSQNKKTNGKESLLSKFKLGHELGFAGEPGFTSFDEDEWFELINNTPTKEKSKVRQNVEGSADKWARTISSWLKKLGLLFSKRLYKNGDYTPNAYGINIIGERLLQKAIGYSKYSPSTKFVSWHMFATSIKNKVYVQKRRAYTLLALSSSHTIEGISNYLENQKMFDGEGVVKSDLLGLTRFGLNIEQKDNKYYLKDSIYGLSINSIPKYNVFDDKKTLEEINALQNKLSNIDPSDIGIVDMAWKKSKTRSSNTTDATLFEAKTIEIMKKYMNLYGIHLGGANKPDGVVYTQNSSYGIIVDTKAYSEGYNLPVDQKREMIDYINEYKNKYVNPHQEIWWKNFPDDLKEVFYLWVAGAYTGNFRDSLREVKQKTNVNGGAMEITALLNIANDIMGNKTTNDILPKLMDNDLIDDKKVERTV